MKKTMIISAFPACGKTYLYENQEKLGFSIMDSDSSKFLKHENWEDDYVAHIVSNLGKYDFIFVAQYPEVLKRLKAKNIEFVVVAPSNDENLSERERQLIKQQWFGRFLLRDNSHIKDLERWILELKENYELWTSYEHLNKYQPKYCILLKENEYLSDRIDELYRIKEGKNEKSRIIYSKARRL